MEVVSSPSPLRIANTPCVQALPAYEVEFLRDMERKNSSPGFPEVLLDLY
jgi:hypothetical protein